MGDDNTDFNVDMTVNRNFFLKLYTEIRKQEIECIEIIENTDTLNKYMALATSGDGNTGITI